MRLSSICNEDGTAMKRLYIIGARGFGREVYNLFLQCKPSLGDMECAGFLDSKADALDSFCGYPPIVSSVEDYMPQPDDVFICALGDVNYKKMYAEKILQRGGRFISLVHPSVEIGSNARIGSGCIMLTCTINCDVSIGDFVTVMGYSVLGHDASVGDWSHLGAYSFLGGFSQVGKLTTLHPGVRLLPHKHVGDNAVIGAGSVVLRNVESGVSVFGIPARLTDTNSDTDMDLKDFMEKFSEAMEIEEPAAIELSTEFRELPQWGSLAYLSVRAMVEEEYGVQIESAQFRKLLTVGDVAAYIMNT